MTPARGLPIVAIVGRPNVGKSTLFNRLARRRLAIVEDVPGVTRDRHYADSEWQGRAFTVVDTGGFLPGRDEPLQEMVRQQAQIAIDESDLVLMVVDARDGLTAGDEEMARILRRAGKPTLVIANKVDDVRKAAVSAGEFFRMGLGDVQPLSAMHGHGVDELADRLVAALPEAPATTNTPVDAEPVIHVAIIGRPNVGKSTLVNALLGEERVITSAVAGTTRDAVDSPLEWRGHRFVLTDTAGIRRKSTISAKTEHFSVLAALKAIDRSDVAALLIDATESAVEQDARIAGIAEDKGRALLLVVNKWDLVRGKTTPAEFTADLRYRLKWAAYAPVVFISAKKKNEVHRVLELAATLFAQQRFRAPTPMLNKLLDHVTTEHPLPSVGGRALRLYYCAQVSEAPPTFVFMCNRPEAVPDRYKRYLVNQVRERFDLQVPVRLLFRERPGKRQRADRLSLIRARKKRRRR